MKLFLVIYTMGMVGGSVGPLPYDKPECELRAAEYRNKLAVALKTGQKEDGTVIPAEDLKTLGTMRFSCELRAVRPAIGEKEPSL